MADEMYGDVSETSQACDRFRESFKYYKKKKPPPDLSNVIDFSTSDNSEVERISVTEPSLPPIEGLQSWQDWKVFCHKHIPGFIYMRNPFLCGYQEYWIQRCIQDYPCKPNLCNLDAHVKLKDSDNIWDLSQGMFSDRLPSKDKALIDRLRWVTLGYHHNWETKHYSADCRSPFPADLDYLARYIVSVLHLSDFFKAEAAIINYYHMDSTLAPHVDQSEFYLKAPLISFSFGQSAVMLMGSVSKAVQPVPVFLHSGDIVVMSGPSRLAYHAVPRIVPTPAHLLPWMQTNDQCQETETYSKHLPPSVNDSSSTDDSSSASDAMMSLKIFVNGQLPEGSSNQVEWFSEINKYINRCVKNSNYKLFQNYMQKVRINMNVRQVFKCEGSFHNIGTDQNISETEAS